MGREEGGARRKKLLFVGVGGWRDVVPACLAEVRVGRAVGRHVETGGPAQNT